MILIPHLCGRKIRNAPHRDHTTGFLWIKGSSSYGRYMDYVFSIYGLFKKKQNSISLSVNAYFDAVIDYISNKVPISINSVRTLSQSPIFGVYYWFINVWSKMKSDFSNFKELVYR